MNIVVGKKYTCEDIENGTYVVNYVGEYFIIATSVHDSSEESFNRRWAEESFTAVPETITVEGYLNSTGESFASEAVVRKFGLSIAGCTKVRAVFTVIEE